MCDANGGDGAGFGIEFRKSSCLTRFSCSLNCLSAFLLSILSCDPEFSNKNNLLIIILIINHISIKSSLLTVTLTKT